MSISLELHFSRDQGVALEKVYFSHPLIGGMRFSVRGKLGGAYGNALTFQWTPAVQALMLLALDEKTASEDQPAILSGGAGSAAASLDYAIGKQPAWLLDMFGVDSQGHAVIRRLIRRTNPERKRGGDVLLSLNPNQLRREQIRLFVNGVEIDAITEVRQLREEIASFWRLTRPTARERANSPAAGLPPQQNAPSPLRVLIAAITANESRAGVNVQLLESRLIEHLVAQNGVEAIAATALVSAQELELPAGILGRKLNCSLVAIGRVEFVSQTVRCVLQLVASDSGSVVWMNSFSGRQRDFANALPELLDGMEAVISSRAGTQREDLRTAA